MITDDTASAIDDLVVALVAETVRAGDGNTAGVVLAAMDRTELLYVAATCIGILARLQRDEGQAS